VFLTKEPDSCSNGTDVDEDKMNAIKIFAPPVSIENLSILSMVSSLFSGNRFEGVSKRTSSELSGNWLDVGRGRGRERS
jgi:hypothetical protein